MQKWKKTKDIGLSENTFYQDQCFLFHPTVRRRHHHRHYHRNFATTVLRVELEMA